MTVSALLRALIRRELNARLLAAMAVTAAAGAAAGRYAVQRHAAEADATGLFDPILRFPTTMLLAAALLLLLRIAGRRHDDHEAAWLDPWCATGGERAAYVVALWASTVVSMWLLFAAGAGAHALTILAVGDSADVLLHMRTMLPAGGLMLGAVGAYGTAVAIVMRNAFSSAIGSVFFVVAAYFAAVYYAIRSGGTSLPRLLDPWLLAVVPAVQPAAGVESVVLQITYILAAGAVAAGLSRWLVGRRA